SSVKIVNDRIGDKSITVGRNTGLGDLRVFEVGPNANVSIAGLTIRDGQTSDDGSAILNSGGRLSLRNCTIINNKTDAGSAVQNNGGILEVSNSSFINNTGIAGGALSNRPINGNPAVTMVN